MASWCSGPISTIATTPCCEPSTARWRSDPCGRRLFVALGLQAEEPRIAAVGGHQARVVALLEDLAAVDDQYLVGGAHRGEAVGDQDGHLVVAVLAEVGEHRCL